MNKNIIGMKLADGSFYPILKRGSPAKKKLQVTTASDNQTTVQINLFCASDESFSDAEYVDTLMIEGIVPHEKSSPAIDLILSLDENDVLTADMSDEESGEVTKSSVSLLTLGEDELDDYLPDFDLVSSEDDFADAIDTSDLDFDESDYASPENDDSFINDDNPGGGITNFDFLEPERRRIPVVPLVCVLCALISILCCLCIVLFVKSSKNTEAQLASAPLPSVKYDTVTVLSEQSDYPQQLQAAVARDDQIVVVDAPVVVPAPAQNVSSAVENKRYQVKWGDTLWDIADTFYKNPWMYDKIAKANNIKNPDFILSGTWIVIPAK